MSVTLSADTIVPNFGTKVNVALYYPPVLETIVIIANGTNSSQAQLFITAVSGVVSLFSPRVGFGTATKNAVYTLDAIPAAYRPNFAQRTPVCVTENNTEVVGRCDIGTDGIITISANAGGAAFTAGATSRIYVQTSYIIV